MAPWKRGWLDGAFAFTMAFVLEAVLVLCDLVVPSALKGDSFWLSVFQMPGNVIAERLFSHSGRLAAWTCAISIQLALYSTLLLGAVYAFRIVWGRDEKK